MANYAQLHSTHAGLQVSSTIASINPDGSNHVNHNGGICETGVTCSVNGDRNKFFYWPAVSAAYRFVNILPHADEIKLRAAIGISGNQPRYGDRDLVLAPNGLIDGRNASTDAIANHNQDP